MGFPKAESGIELKEGGDGSNYSEVSSVWSFYGASETIQPMIKNVVLYHEISKKVYTTVSIMLITRVINSKGNFKE